MKSWDVRRREFLKFLGVGSAAAASGCSEDPGSGSSDVTETEFDYIVVGSGAGGGPLACNLARAGKRVLLLEAGDDQGKLIEVAAKTSTETP